MTARILDLINGVVTVVAAALALLLTLVLLARPARGDEPNAPETLERFVARCIPDLSQIKTLEQVRDSAYCVGYLNGMIEVHTILAGAGRARPQWCLPEAGISNAEAQKVIIKWADDHPERLHESARVEIMIALVTAFPCPQ
jgi:hypothetical protein